MTAPQATLTVNIRTDYTVVDSHTLLAAAQALARKLSAPQPSSEREALRTLLLHLDYRDMQERAGDYGLHRGGTAMVATDDGIQSDRQGAHFPEVLLRLAGPGGGVPSPGPAESVGPT